MALIEDMFKGGVPGLLVGVGVALAAPILLPAAATGARPLAKALIIELQLSWFTLRSHEMETTTAYPFAA